MTTIDIEIETALAQSVFYRFFSLAFRYPTQESVRALGDSTLGEELGEADAFLARKKKTRYSPLLKELEAESARLSPVLFESEFARTFGHSVGGNAPAYEMEYGDPESFWGPHELADIAAFYRSFGLKVGGRNPDRVDHVSVECEFMCLMNYRLAYAIEAGHDGGKIQMIRDSVKKFYEDHIGRWSFAFSRRLEKSTESVFYKTLARLFTLFLEDEAERLQAHAGSAELKLRTVPFGEEETPAACQSCQLNSFVSGQDPS